MNIKFLFRNVRYANYYSIGKQSDNFNKIIATKRISVEPGLEYRENPVDFKMTSDAFFSSLSKAEILEPHIKFDVIFIDGLHLAEQVDRDIENSLKFIKNDGFVVLHDCNPPTQWHPREEFVFGFSPAGGYWNGTAWKAFLKGRSNPNIHSCCIDSDSGVGILTKKFPIGLATKKSNIFYEYNVFDKNRKDYLNLISFEDLKLILNQPNL